MYKQQALASASWVALTSLSSRILSRSPSKIWAPSRKADQEKESSNATSYSHSTTLTFEFVFDKKSCQDGDKIAQCLKG
jgi:hypothetical protein